jgi:beta-N-acetylhexosaminidase
MMAALREKIGQMFMVGVRAEELSADEQRTLRDYPFGGFILFTQNCRAAERMAALCRSLAQTGKELMPFIAIDHEGGRVHRLPEPFTRFPPARTVGRSGNPDLAYRIARAMAAELTLAGINLNFAPVLDVDSNPGHGIIGDRSFARDAQEVIRFGGNFVEGLRHGGIIPCGKHFPGHGDCATDSHVALPRVEKSSIELTEVELRPFVHACRQGIESIMTAHVLYCALDAEFPATLSRKIVTGLLRHWGYGGVVFSDDMEMRALADNYAPEEGVERAVAAGVDVVVYGHDLGGAARCFEHLAARSESDAALRARVEDSYRRIAALKRRFLKTFTGVPPSELRRRLAELEHQRLCVEIQGSL